MIKLEICASSIESALNAQNAKADRVELCSELSVGGITPSKGMIQMARELLDIPLYVLIRPRSGDFHYSIMELEIMKEDIAFCAEIGCNGVVIGALTEDRRIDEAKTMLLMQEAGFMDVTFHKAFDEVQNQFEALDTLKEMGVQRVLTSGGAETALMGMDTLGELIDEADDEIIVMPGGGVRPENIEQLKGLGATEYHSAAMLDGAKHSDLETINRLRGALS
ncbi:copper homeostasis protein CutC [Roseivirga sp. E12]|uniref:copper homeostasis protein CutC n=1 Tax=Roseivirga sp. E12 TaxID=2819237 RepID=UPI001ABC8FF5|nr:copper homeostasis protein CutC [Roseivirga sp. E12]MBO3697068.1 copper homeostasis protein CutC [Roseivirga sp. E12]